MHAETELSDRYRLTRRLASGGMGEVWLADDLVLGREVAVKVLAVASGADAAAVERFDREARTLAALQHPNIVTIFDIGTRSGTAFMVMELLAGPTLAQLLAERGVLPEPEAVRLGAQIAAGLSAAHRAGIIHRDIKPSNLMFTSSGTLKILDFGIARLSQTGSSALTATNAVIGSASYLSPEQAAGAAVDERSDLYALGCVLMAMVAGRPPFAADHPMAIMHQQIHDDPPPLRALQPAASPALEALVGRLLSKRPDARPATASEVEALLTGMTSVLHDGSGATATLVLPVGPLPVPGTPGPAATVAYATAPGLGGPVPGTPGPAATRAYPTAPGPAVPVPAAGRPAAEAPPARRGSRRWWLVAAGLASVAALTALALATLPDRIGQEASGTPAPSTSSVPTTPTPATATPTLASASPKSIPQSTAPAGSATPLDEVRAAVDAVVARGQLDPARAEEMARRLDDLARKLGEGNKDVKKQVEGFSRYLAGLVKKGELTEAGFDRIQAALDQL